MMLTACAVLGQCPSVVLMRRETGVDPSTLHTDREYGTVVVDLCLHFRSLPVVTVLLINVFFCYCHRCVVSCNASSLLVV